MTVPSTPEDCVREAGKAIKRWGNTNGFTTSFYVDPPRVTVETTEWDLTMRADTSDRAKVEMARMLGLLGS